jgi:DNA (cytosine-5)-methyltransferase 1
VADAAEGRWGSRGSSEPGAIGRTRTAIDGLRAAGGLADAVRAGRPERRPRAGERPAAGSGGAGGLADTDQAGQRELWCSGLPEDGDAPQRHDADGCRTHGGLGNTDEPGSQGRGEHIGEHADQRPLGAPSLPSRLGHSKTVGWDIERDDCNAPKRHEVSAGVGSLNFWSDADWLPCTDGKARRIEPGTFPLAHGVPARMGRLRGYGNAIVPQVAAEFIRAFAGIGAVR